MFGFLLGEALRDLRRAGRVAVSAIMLITLSLAALGAFWLLSSNLGQAVAQFRERVKIVVYLKREPPAAEASALAERVRRMPGVASVRYVGKTEALGVLKQVLGKDAAVADSLAAEPAAGVAGDHADRRGLHARGRPRAGHPAGDPAGDGRDRRGRGLDRALRPRSASALGLRPRRGRRAGPGRHPDGHHRHHARPARPARRDGDHAAGRRARARRPHAAAAAGHDAGAHGRDAGRLGADRLLCAPGAAPGAAGERGARAWPGSRSCAP